MARAIPADRFRRLVDCATQVFIERGYAHTQMADVAEAMGIGKGTLYLYVESKEALFDLVLRSADAEHPPGPGNAEPACADAHTDASSDTARKPDAASANAVSNIV